MESNELLKVEEVAVYLRVTKGTVWRWCRTGEIPCVKIGHQWRIRRDDFERLVRSNFAHDGEKELEDKE